MGHEIDSKADSPTDSSRDEYEMELPDVPRPGHAGPRRRKARSFADLKERGERTRGDEVNYFKVDTNCLGCGARARVKVDKLHGKLRCRKCGTVMHMAQNGTWKLGPPPTLIDDSRQAGKGGEYRPPSRLEKLLEKYPALKRPATIWSAIAVLAAILVLWGANSYYGGAVDLPPNVHGRAGLICEALLDNDTDLFEQLMAATGRSQAKQWFAAIRKRIERVKADGPPKFVVRVLYEREKDGTACVIAKFTAPPNPSDAVPGSGRELFQCAMYFVSDGSRGLLFDGRRTFKEM